jgi:hypothetical protein
MSRSWFFFGLVAVATAAGFAGCTITTDTNGNEGGAGGDGGYSGGGAENGGGGTDQGGTSNGGSGGTDQGGTTSTAGGSSQGGTSSQGSFSDAAKKVCAIQQVWSCLGDSTAQCETYYDDANVAFSKCESLFTKYLECVLKAPTSDLKCASATLTVSTCKPEEDTWFECGLKP